MSVIVKSSSDDTIGLPAWLMAALNLREGEEVKAVVDGRAIRLASLAEFLALRGALADDEAFDRAIDFIDQAWKSWTAPTSV